ncbi:MAG: HlyD family efflux transporter periplasmic adaptor subunit [Parvibaculaceae bacterium]
MPVLVRKWIVPAIAGLLLLGGLTYAFWPQPVTVDLGTAERGAMMVTVDDEGETRVKEVYLVSAPLPGRVLRLEGDVGDPVVAGETPLATIRPTTPAFLDSRTRSELEAAVKAAQAARTLAEAELERLQALYDYAKAEYERAKPLAERGTISRSRLDHALMEVRTQAAALQTAQANFNVRDFELQRAKAALLEPEDPRSTTSGECCFIAKAPVSGQILRLLQESETVIQAGAPLVEIGDPAQLEIVVDLLSSDAVLVSPGDKVIIDDWGGATPLAGRVQRVEPFGFTKISALGIEEQRVNVIIDFTDPYEKWQRLGHGYRVDVQIVLWESDDVLHVPISALFRHGGKWAVFSVVDGDATLTPVTIGHMNTRSAEVIDGLNEGQALVLHPSDRVVDGISVVGRTSL